MKKLFALILALAMALSLAACGGTDEGTYKIAIVQQLSHSSLDEIRSAVETRLEELAREQGISISCEDFNGQNDPTALSQIGARVASGGYDAVIPIGTLAAQSMVTAMENSGIPVIYAAVSDPDEAGLTDLAQVTGTCDALNTELILDMMFAIAPDIQTVGLLYSNSETNAQKPVAEAKAYLEAKGIACLEKTGNTADEVLSAASALVDRCDAVFTPTDNVVMNVAGAVADTLARAGIPYYTGADSFVSAGAFATCGVNYTALGTATADLAAQVLVEGQVPQYRVMDGGIITVNTETARKLGLDYDVFRAMADTLLEVDGM